MSFLPCHRIYTYDGGWDGFGGARWIANAQWLGPGHMARGATQEEAVANLRKHLAGRYPNAPWFAQVPVERGERELREEGGAEDE